MKIFKKRVKGLGKPRNNIGAIGVGIAVGGVLIGGAAGALWGYVGIILGAMAGFLVGGVIGTLVIDKARFLR